MLAIPDPYGLTSSDALSLAAERDLFPSSLSAREIQDTVPASLRDRAVFSARTTNARYLQALSDRIQRYLAAGYRGDKASLRVELKKELARLGYSPERGFPGDKALGIPPVRPGGLQDLSSDRRINLILDTQLRLMTGAAQRTAGLDPLARERFPAWELVRLEPRAAPRDWQLRWLQAGGALAEGGRMIALKDAEIWSALGDPSLFKDAIGVNHPPFAYQSGMGWDQIDEEEAIKLGILLGPITPIRPPNVVDLFPDAVVSTDGLTPSILQRLKTSLGSLLTAATKSFRWIFSRGETNALPEAPEADLLLCLATLAVALHDRSDH